MGNSGNRPLTAGVGSGDPSSTTAPNFQADLPKFIVQSRIGNGKLMKTYLMRCEGNSVVVKVYYPFLLPIQLWMKSPSVTMSRTSRLASNIQTPVYLIRQYLYANLLDRLSTRPFLSEIEKLWILFQLFKALETCHSLDVIHGDVKPENVLCTTWNWVVLTDFALFKPVLIPDDDPSDFQYYFDTMNRPRCSIAPERFYGKKMGKGGTTIAAGNAAALRMNTGGLGLTPTSSSIGSSSSSTAAIDSELLSDSVFGDFATGSTPGGRTTQTSSVNTPVPPGPPQLTAAMDVFSLGCTMAEVVLDGEPLLDLPGMLKYLSSSSNNSSNNLNNHTSAASSSSPQPPSSSFGQRTDKQSSSIPMSTDSRGTAASGVERLDHVNSPAKSLLDRIANSRVRQVVTHMTQKDPRNRLTVTEYRKVLEGHRSLTDERTPGAAGGIGGAVGRPADRTMPFPPYFSDVLYPMFLKLHWEGVGPDERIAIICRHYGDLMKSMTGDEDSDGGLFFDTENTASKSFAKKSPSTSKHEVQSSSVPGDDRLSTEALLLRCQQAIADAEQRYQRTNTNSSSSSSSAHASMTADRGHANAATNDSKPQHTPAPDRWKQSRRFFGKPSAYASISSDEGQWLFQREKRVSGDNRRVSESHGLIILVQVVTSCFRHLSLPRSRIVSIMLLVRMGLCSGASHMCDDSEAALKRILPTLLVALTDASAGIRALAVRALCAILSAAQGQQVSALETDVFPQYVFPALNSIARDPETVVRVAFAECLGTIAETARLFLDRAHLMALQRAVAVGAAAASAVASRTVARNKDKDDTPGIAVANVTFDSGGNHSSSNGDDGSNLELNVDFPYDAKLKALHEQVSRWVRDVSNVHTPAADTSSGSLIRRALLCDIHRLCIFFGQEATTDLLLTQVLTFLNDQDWELRLAFCAKIPTMCAFLGSTVTSECILPFIENALVDVEERVVEEALHCILSLVQISLLTRLMTVDAVRSAAPLLLHPACVVRVAARNLVVAAAAALGQTDATVFLLPLIRPALLWDLTGCSLSTDVLTQALTGPVSRKAYQQALLERRTHASSVVKSSKDSAIDISFQSGSSDATIDVGKDSPVRQSEHLPPVAVTSPDIDASGETEKQFPPTNRHLWAHSHPSTDSFEFDNDGPPSETSSAVYDPNAPSSSSSKKKQQRENARTATPASILTATSFSEDADEPLKLLFMKGYLDQAAKELAFRGNSAIHDVDVEINDDVDWVTDLMNQRETNFASSAASVILWNMLVNNNQRGLNAGLTSQLSKVSGSNGAMNGLGGMSDATSQCLRVPHQGNYFCNGGRVVPTQPWQQIFLTEQDRGVAKTVVEGPAGLRHGRGKGRGSSHRGLSERVRVRILDDDDHINHVDKALAGGVAVTTATGPTMSKEDAAAVRGNVVLGDIVNCDVDPTGPGDATHESRKEIAPTAAELPEVPSAQIQSLFGIVPTNGSLDALRGGGRLRHRSSSMSFGDIADLTGNDEGWMSSAKDPNTLQPLTARRVHRTTSGTNGDSSTQLSQRIRALGIPPLPPDLGYLASSSSVLSSALQHETLDANNINNNNMAAANLNLQHQPQQQYQQQPQQGFINNVVGARPFWAAREGTLTTCLREHTGAVHRLMVAPDQIYFASASADKTIKIWQVRGLDKAAFPRSSVTYTGHKSSVVDLAIIDSSRSIVSCSDDGEVHVWRVDYDGGSMRGLSTVRRIDPADGPLVAVGHFTGEVASVVTYCSHHGGIGGWDLRSSSEAFHYTVPPEFGSPTCMANTASVSLGDSQDSSFHSSSTIIEQPWVMVGTSLGYLLLWDVRFNVICKAWRHSTGTAILRLVAGRSVGSAGMGTNNGGGFTGDVDGGGTGSGGGNVVGGGIASGFGVMGIGFETFGGIGNGQSPSISNASASSSAATQDSSSNGADTGMGGGGVGGGGDTGNNSFPYLLVTTAGDNEVALWSLPIPEDGTSLRCFRALDVAASRIPSSSRSPSPRLVEVAIPRNGYLAMSIVNNPTSSLSANKSNSSSMRAFIGQICHTSSGTLHASASYVLTAGDDRQIRYWDVASALKCFVFAGIPYAQHKPTFASSFSSDNNAASSKNSPGSPMRSGLNAAANNEDISKGGTLFCYDTTIPSVETILQAQIPVHEGRGPCQADIGSKGAILDLKMIDYPKKMLISCGRDGDIKIWR